MQHLTKNWFEVTAIKIFIGKDQDQLQIISNGDRKEAIAVYSESEGLPNPADLKVVWEGTGLSVPLLSLAGEMSFVKMYVNEKNKMLEILDGENNE